jgi:hypothetical protein
MTLLQLPRSASKHAKQSVQKVSPLFVLCMTSAASVSRWASESHERVGSHLQPKESLSAKVPQRCLPCMGAQNLHFKSQVKRPSGWGDSIHSGRLESGSFSTASIFVKSKPSLSPPPKITFPNISHIDALHLVEFWGFLGHFCQNCVFCTLWCTRHE